MKARKKIVSLILALALILSTLAIGVSAVLGDGQEISVDVNLEVGWQTGDVFTPLAPGEELQAGDVLTVRICPTTDFLTGITRYIVMYSKPMFKVVGEQKDAFTPNYAHPFWASVASGWTGATGTAGAGVPTRGWPESMLSTAEGGDGTFDNYTAVAVNNLAGPASGSGGYPGYLTTGEWLFRFNLTVLQDITDASQARIWMDKRWLAGPSYTQGAMYFVKCTPTQYAALGSAIAYAYDLDLTGADITLPLAGGVETSTITFDSDGGTAVDPITQEEGSAVTAPADPTKDGFIFDGWQPAVPATMPVDDMTCVAQWIPVPFATSTITFDSDGGTAVDPITQEEGSAVTAPADPTKDGFIFDGWQPAVPATMPVDDVTCVAQWAVNTYNAIFMVDGAVYATVPTVFGAAIAPPANPAKFGYVFTGWDPVPGTMGAADETFTALFEDSTLNVFNAALPPHYFGQLAPITISVIGSPSKIQLLNKGNDTTRTFSRTNTNVVSIQGYDSQNNPVEAGAEPAYEVWVINVALKQGDFSVRAKYNKTWDSFEAGFLLTVDFVDPAFYSFDIDNANVIQGSTSVFTVVTSLDVTKVQFVDGKGNTRTFTTDKAVCTDDQAAFTRTWTINVKVAKAGSYNWILKGRSGTTWTTTGLSVSFDVVKGA